MAEPADNLHCAIGNARDILQKGMYHKLFPPGLEISPGLNEVYELALAYYESRILTKKELIKNKNS